MFKNIKELYNIFVNTYRSFYAMKLKAKEEMKKYRIILDKIQTVANKICKIRMDIDEIFIYLPIPERRDFVQKTRDLLIIGRVKEDGFDGFSIIQRYINLYEKMKCNYKILQNKYKDGQYNKVIELVEEFITDLENFYKYNGIKE